MATTIKDIARVANVSNPAVSAVLNNKTNCRVSPATRERILHAAREMNYKPNFSGLLLRGEKTKTVALLISQIWHKSEEFMKDMIISLMRQFDDQGYACYFADIAGDADSNCTKVQEFISRGVHHFVFLGSPHGREQIKELIESRNKSYIVYGSSSFLNRYVESDTVSGVASIIRFFLSRGKSNFRMLINAVDKGNMLANPWICGLIAAFPDVDLETLLKRHVTEFDAAKYYKLDSFVKSGYEETMMIIKEYPHIQAIFYLSDFYAIGGAKLLLEKGFNIGRDILLAGFNESSAARNYPYPISSVEYDIDKITQAITEESLKENRPFNVLVPTIVHIREL